MKTKAFRVAVLIGCALLCGCTKSNNSVETLRNSATRPFPSEAELTNAVPAGLPKTKLITRFGAPFIEMPMEKGTQMLVYELPGLRDDVPTNWQYSGFSVTLTNDRVAHVAASHRDLTMYRPSASRKASEETNEPVGQNTKARLVGSIAFHEVSDDPVPGGRYLDTQNLPKAGYIRDQADFVVTEVVSVERGRQVFGAGSNDTREALTVTLTEADAKRFAKVTERLLGKRLLISVGTEPVVAPIVQAPIQNGSFILTVQSPAEAKRLFDQILAMARK